MEYQTIVLEKKDNIVTLTLNRPEKLNALNPQMMVELVDAFRSINQDDETMVLVITGAGRGFCSGADLSARAGSQGPSSSGEDRPEREIDDITLKGFPREAPLALVGMRKPVIAAINGVAVGGGCTLTLACDIRIASEAARFSIPLTRVGLTLELGSSYFLSRVVGIGKACELVFTGRMIDANEAKEIGLVNQVVPAEQLMDTCMELAKKIASKGPIAVELAKKVINEGIEEKLDKGTDYESDEFGECFASGEAKEGMTAFLEKRKPNW